MTEYRYGAASESRLAECTEPLERLFREAIRHRDISIICGHRNELDQNQAVADGVSFVRWPDGAHNSIPSRAVDAIPYPTTAEDWKNREFWVEWTSWVKGLASGMGIEIVSGYDWDNDYELDDQKFYDGPHFEEVDGAERP